MSIYTIHLAVTGLIRHGDEVLLIQQQAPDAPEPNWALPGGGVERGEGLMDALAREIREETGLFISHPHRLLYSAHGAGVSESWAVYVFDIHTWSGQLVPADPDGHILTARFLPVSKAIERLETLSWRPMREPIVAYLRGDQEPGAVWCYRDYADGSSDLVHVVG